MKVKTTVIEKVTGKDLLQPGRKEPRYCQTK